MKIRDILKPECIIEDMRAENKRDALAELSARIRQIQSNCDSDAMLKVLLEREKLGSTGIGEGIAIPHGKIKGLDDMVISFGRSRNGIDFEALDNRPAHLFFLLLAPEESAGKHLKALAKISRMLKDKTFRKMLMDAKSGADLYRMILDKDDSG
jgi:PTS system nitrogen regulatory IIA component